MIAAQRRGVAEQEVADQHRHRPAHVGVGRHQRVAGAVGLIGQGRHRGPHLGLQQRNAPPQVEPEVERHLLVARAPGVQAPPVVADERHQLPFDEAVDVLVVAADPGGIGAAALENLLQSLADAADGRGIEGAGLLQGLGPRQAAGDVVLEQAPIERERHPEVERRRIGRAVEPSRPQMPAHASTSIRPCPIVILTSPDTSANTWAAKASSPPRRRVNQWPSRTSRA